MTREVLKANIANGQFGMVSQVRITDELGFEDGIYAEKEIRSSKRDMVDIKEEVSRWNEYFTAIGKEELVQAKAVGDIMYTPWIEGNEPSAEEVKQAVTDLYRMDYFMADPKPDNFKKLINGQVIPVDFGEIYHRDSPKTPIKSIGLIHNTPFDYSKYFPDVDEIGTAYFNYQSKRYDAESAEKIHNLENSNSFMGFTSDLEVPMLMPVPKGGFGKKKQEETPMVFAEKEKESTLCCGPITCNIL
ncbi:MAG: hypothetical protein EP298_13410 [Gammaproteobacteria bacterium]|nr:MAG: hypothetical protein EP298_13410 [Gammaproteobacteria bacterium]UTW41724.1 hypothetical protein KFE69_09425 [bacterium SCSIO 12844]